MKKTIFSFLAVVLFLGIVITGCTQKAASSSEAIEKSKTMQTADQKANYLISQAKAFYNSKDYKDAISTAQYIANNFDMKKEEAKKIIEQAKNDMAATAQGALSDMQKAMGK